MTKTSAREHIDPLLNHYLKEKDEFIIQSGLYHLQGAYQALNERPLFHEHIYRWTIGPVVPCVWYHRKYGYLATDVESIKKENPVLAELCKEMATFLESHPMSEFILNPCHEKWRQCDLNKVISLQDYPHTDLEEQWLHIMEDVLQKMCEELSKDELERAKIEREYLANQGSIIHKQN